MRFSFAPLIVWQTIRTIGLAFAVFSLVFQMIYLVISRGDVYSPGANDNASGVAVVLALARHLHEASLAHLDTHYALLTAEEMGLIGSQQFVKGTSLPKENTYVINLDMVGTGRRLCYVRGSGLLPPRFTDRYLNALLREAHPPIKPHYYFMGDSDFASFLAKGFRATSLLTTGDDRAETVYHTDRDTIQHIDAESLQLTANVVAGVMRLLDERIGK
jgi:Zn-dependent M28 family amino/carboxypeptidase